MRRYTDDRPNDFRDDEERDNWRPSTAERERAYERELDMDYGRHEAMPLGDIIACILAHIERLRQDPEYLKAESPIEQTMIARFRWLYPTLELRTQVPVGPYRADIIVAGRIAVECDGREFHSTPRQMANDAKRDVFFQRSGFMVMRFKGRDIHLHPDDCVNEVAERLGLRPSGGRQVA